MSRTTKITLILSILAAIFAGIYWFFNKVSNEVQLELNAAIKPMFTDITEHHWDMKILTKYSPPNETTKQETLKLNDKDKLAYKQLRDLGDFKQYNGLKAYQYRADSKSGSAKATFEIDFSTGPRLFNVVLIKINGKWYLDAFALLKQTSLEKK